MHLQGTSLSDGIALGHVVLHEPRVVITNVIADDVPGEIKRLDAAIAKLRADLDQLVEHRDVADGGEHRDVLEAYRMFSYDQGWLHKIREAVMTGLTAEAGVERVQSDTRARMLRASDPYMRDRLHDLDDLANRLMRVLMGKDHAPGKEQLPDNAILVARSMGPAALLDYDRKKLRGLVLEEGGPTSHVSIVARALGIPTVGEIENATGLVEEGDAIIVDGSTGNVHMRPPQDIEAAYGERVKLRARRQAQYRALRDKPCVTKDGCTIALMINAGLTIDLPHIAGDRRRRHRPVPHRIAVHGGADAAAHRRADEALQNRARRRRQEAGDLPHPRYWRRQGAALLAQFRRGKPGAGLARDQARARPARPVAQQLRALAAAPPADANCA